uniref:Uncharacterized protein n=1 Tax=Poecilia formosa TaxID=48698 RepID=A0A096M1C3_POEFO
ILDKFAQNLADNIILSSLEQMEKLEPAELQPIQTPETLAEELASAIVEVALKDVCLPQYPPSDSNHPPLYQSGLPAVGSLDYPDAPPTTPLIPELERSRNSFARKLKGGLAKVFLPSPPPPTPKDKED